jgi:hypothetical protein
VALRDELTEPWGLLLGATAAGTAWAVGLPAAAAAGVGAVVWATKAATAALERRRPPRLTGRRLPVDARAPEGVWLQRSDRAAASFAELAGSMTTGPLAERVAMMQPQVAETVQALHRRAGASGDIAVQLNRSLASIRAQQEIHQRLVAVRNGILARLESGTLGLESLVTRVIELSAMAVSGPDGEVGGIDQLGDELEGIRQGLAETEEVSRQALNAYQRNDPA